MKFFSVLFLAGILSTGVLGDMELAAEVDGSSVSLTVDGTAWFTQTQPYSNVMVNKDFEEYSQSNGNLTLLSSSAMEAGEDALGSFDGSGIEMRWQPEELGFSSSARSYPEENVVVFKQSFSSEVSGSSVAEAAGEASARDATTTVFPSLTVNPELELGFLSFGGFMAGWEAPSVGTLSTTTSTIRTGQFGGPVAFFDRSGSNCVVLSPLSKFMVANMAHRRQEDDGDTLHTLDFGVMGSVESIPADYELEVVAAWGAGIVEALENWGDAVNRYYGKQNVVDDVVTKYLGLWTDNGAYYYYNTEEGLDYEETLLALKSYVDEVGIPIKYVDLDSWWYHKGEANGVKNWTEIPSVFPSGLGEVHESTGWPFAAHNRYWAPDTDYATQNGGEYSFVVEEENGKALPADVELWRALFADGVDRWGLDVYEQDWLDREFVDMDITHKDVNAASDWLNQMGRAAEETGVTIQYCMALPR